MDRTQKTVIPKVRYHPTIQTHMPGDGARTKTRTGPQTGTDRSNVQENQDANNRVPDTRKKQKQGAPKPVQGGATDPDPRQTPARVRPEPVPLSPGVKSDKCTVEEVEVLTRGQRTNRDWFAWRKNRITASVAHSIAHCRFVNGRSKTPPTSYLAAVTGRPRPSVLINRTMIGFIDTFHVCKTKTIDQINFDDGWENDRKAIVTVVNKDGRHISASCLCPTQTWSSSWSSSCSVVFTSVRICAAVIRGRSHDVEFPPT